MEVKHLMVNDIVEFDNVYTAIGRIISVSAYRNAVEISEIDNEDNDIVARYAKDIKPVKLMNEMLEANGFVYRDLPFQMYWEFDGVTVFENGTSFYIPVGQNRSIDVSNVHQLQQALRGLGLNDLADNFNVNYWRK